MKILKKENWWIWLLLFIFSSGTSTLVLGALLDVFDKNAWYIRWTKKIPKWLIIGIIGLFIVGYISLSSFVITRGNVEDVFFTTTSVAFSLLMLLFTITILFISISISIFMLQILCMTCSKLEVPGSEIYLSPYIWLLCFIVPIIGWIFLFVMLIYLNIYTIVMLYR